MTNTDQNCLSSDGEDAEPPYPPQVPTKAPEVGVDLYVVGPDDETVSVGAPIGPPVEPGMKKAGNGSPIPVEEWLAQAVTITGDIDRKGTVGNRSFDALTKKKPTIAAIAAMAARTTRTNGTRTRSKVRTNGSPPPDRARPSNRDGREIIGAFTPVASVGSGRAVRPVNGNHDDGRVVIGVIQSADDHLDRPGSVVRNPLMGRRLLWLASVTIGLIALGAGTGYILAGYLPERWTAEAEIVMDAGTIQPDRFLATQQVLIQSSVVLDQVAVELSIDRKSIEDELKVFPVDSSSALGINYVDSDPELAKSVVSAVLSAFVSELSAATVDDTAKVYAERLDSLTEQRQMIEQRLAVLELANAEAEVAELAIPHPAEVRRLALESEQLLNQIVALEQALLVEQVGEIERTEAVVVTEPRVLSEPSWPKPLALSAVGALVGAVMAVLALFLIATYGSPIGESRPEGDVH